MTWNRLRSAYILLAALAGGALLLGQRGLYYAFMFSALPLLTLDWLVTTRDWAVRKCWPVLVGGWAALLLVWTVALLSAGLALPPMPPR